MPEHGFTTISPKATPEELNGAGIPIGLSSKAETCGSQIWYWNYWQFQHVHRLIGTSSNCFSPVLFLYSVNYRFLGMLNFTLLLFKDGSELACTEPQSVGGTGKVIATPVRNDNASKPEVDDTLVNDPKDEQSTKPSGEGPAVPANADPPKPDSQQKADEKEKEDDNKEVGADGEPNVSQAMQEMNRKARPTGWLHFKNAHCFLTHISPIL